MRSVGLIGINRSKKEIGADNVISLDLSSFTQSDISKIKSLGRNNTSLPMV